MSSPIRRRTSTTSPQKMVQSPRKNGVSSPTRSAITAYASESVDNLQAEVQKLQFSVGERDVEIERMKTTLIALNGKLSRLQDVQKDLDSHKSFLNTSENKRVEFQTHIEVVTQTIRTDTQQHDAKHEKAIMDIEELQREIQDLKSKMHERENEHLKTVEQLNQDHYQEIAEKDEFQKRMEQEFNDLTLEQEQAHLDKIQELQKQFASNLDSDDNGHQAELRKLDQEKTRREQEYIRKTRDLQSQHAAEIEKLTREAADKLKRTIDAHTEELNQFRLQQQQRDAQHRDGIDNMRREFKTMLQEMQQKHEEENREREDRHAEEIRARIRIQEDSERDLNEQLEKQRQVKDQIISDLHRKIEEIRVTYETKIDSMTITIERLEKQILILTSNITGLEEEVYKKRDVESQLKEALDRELESQDARNALQKDLENATDYILELEEKVYKANKTSLELLKQLKEAESELETLKQYIMDLKHNVAVYIPVEGDQIDRRLAEYINNFPERQKLKIMFMRESEGVYQFGTKRVAVKLEKDCIKIRVGGGYLSIDEFLDQYTPVEIERLEWQDPMRRYEQKVAVQKTIALNQTGRETSPIRQGSPLHRQRSSGGHHSPSPTRLKRQSSGGASRAFKNF